MAIAKSGLLRGLVGQTSGLVMAQAKNGTIVREYKSTITNPKTPAQEANRRVFKAVVENVSAVNNELYQLYGSVSMASYSKLVSMTMRNLGARIMNSFQNATSERVPAMFNAIGVNNEKNKLGVLNLERANITATITGDNNQPVQSFALNLGRSTGEPGIDKVYFGCDYAIGDLRLDIVSAYGRATSGINVYFQQIGGVEGGEKNIGFFESVDECGSGWKYIYFINPNNENNAVFFSFSSGNFTNYRTVYLKGIKAPYGDGQGNFIYCTALLSSTMGNAVASKQGGLILSAGNFVSKVTTL